MSFHKKFSVSCIVFFSVLSLYMAFVFGYKAYRIQKISDFYRVQQAIAVQARLINSPSTAAKKIAENQPVRILVLEGGGIDGIISTKLLAFLEQQSGRPISDLFDIISGTSVGTLQSALLTVPDANQRPKYTTTDLLNILRHDSSKALEVTPFNWFASGFGVISPLMDTGHYIALLKHYFGMTQLNQLTNNVLMTGYAIPERQVMLFTSRTAAINADNYLMYQLLSGITAIPGIMPPQKVTGLTHHASLLLADPGTIINNPIVAALQYANVLYPHHKKILVFLGIGLDELREKKHESHYFNGVFGALMEYYNMTWSHDKLLKLFMKQLQQSHAFGLSQLFFIEEDLIAAGSITSSAHETITSLEKTGDTIVLRYKPQLMQLISQLER